MAFDLSMNGVADSARSWADRLNGAVPGLATSAAKPGAAVYDALQALAKAVDTVEMTKESLVGVLTDPRLLAQYKYDQASAAMPPVYQAALKSVDALASAIATARTNATKALFKGKAPAAPDSPMCAFQAAEITKLLEAAPGGGLTRIQIVQKLLSDAIANEDSLTADVVLNRLGVVYQRLGVNTALLFAQLAQSAQESPVPDTSGNAELLAMFSQGGSGTLLGLCDAARYVVTTNQQQYNSWLADSLRTGSFKGIMDSAPRPSGDGAIPGGLGGPVPTLTRQESRWGR